MTGSLRTCSWPQAPGGGLRDGGLDLGCYTELVGSQIAAGGSLEPELGAPAGRHRVAVSALSSPPAVTLGLSPRAVILRIPQPGWEGRSCILRAEMLK